MKFKNGSYLLLLISTIWIIECSGGRFGGGFRSSGSRGSSRGSSKSSGKSWWSSSKSKPSSSSVSSKYKPSAPTLKEISLPSYASVKNKPPSYSAIHPYGRPPAYSAIHPNGPPPPYSIIRSNAPPPSYSSIYSNSSPSRYAPSAPVMPGLSPYAPSAPNTNSYGWNIPNQKTYIPSSKSSIGGSNTYYQPHSYYPSNYGGSYGSFPNNNNYYTNRGSTSNDILSGIALWELSRNRNNYHVYHVHHYNQNGGNKNTITEVPKDSVITANNTYIVTPKNVPCKTEETKNTNNNTITLTLTCVSTNSFEAVVILPSNTTVTIPCNSQAGITNQCKGSVNLKEELMKPLPNITKDSVFGIPMCNVTIYVENEDHTSTTSTTSEKTPTTTEDWVKIFIERRQKITEEWNSNKLSDIDSMFRETTTPKPKTLKLISVPCIYISPEQQKLQAQSSIATLQNLDQKTVKALAESAYLGDIYKIFSL